MNLWICDRWRGTRIAVGLRPEDEPIAVCERAAGAYPQTGQVEFEADQPFIDRLVSLKAFDHPPIGAAPGKWRDNHVGFVAGMPIFVVEGEECKSV